MSINTHASSANTDAMDSLENTVAVTTTQTNTSAWNGEPTLTKPNHQTAPRQGEQRIVPDHEDLSERLYSLIDPAGTGNDYITYGPSGAPTVIYEVLNVLRSASPFIRNLSLYAGFSYDKIIVTCSLSSPKGIIGGIHCGYYPWAPWFEDFDINDEIARNTLNEMTLQRLWLSPEAHLLTYSSGQDVKFEIPWTFPVAFLPTVVVGYGDTTGIPGEPLVYVSPVAANYISSVSLPARFRVYVQFVGLKYYGPYLLPEGDALSRRRDLPVAQSGLEIAAATGAAIVAEKTIETGMKFVSSLFDSTPDEKEDFGSESASSYTKPLAVQQAFVGDSTSVGPPPTTPIFHNWLESGAVHPIKDFLKRPQYIHTINTSSSVNSTFYASPVFPRGHENGDNQCCTYFRWFSAAAQFWRGTINFHFIVMGHPMIEVQHQLVISYPDAGSVVAPTYSVGDYAALKGVTNGVAHIVVPMPYFNMADHMPIFDSLIDDYSDNIRYIASKVIVNFSVVSTMLDVSPTVPIAVYMSAGDDFEFYQPYAIGMNNVETVSSYALHRRHLLPKAQIALPAITTIFQTRAETCPPTSTLPPLTNVETFMSLWSRALPYYKYDSHGEPYPQAQAMGSPVSWPLNGGSAAWTLNVNNSWYNTCDYVQYFSSQFLLYRGSIGCKLIASASSIAAFDYMYVGLNPLSYMAGVLVPTRQKVNNPYTSDASTTLPVDANFGNGLIVTPTAKQPVIDLTLPYRSSLLWTTVDPSWIDGYDLDNGIAEGSTTNSVFTNFNLQTYEGDLEDILYRKAGPDYRLAIEGLLPPAPLWCAKGFDWS